MAFDASELLKHLPRLPGVYCMRDDQGMVIYVGKARNLRQRVRSYFHNPSALSPRIRQMVSRVAGVDITATHTENEALILENNLIKARRPRYNILFRDDKDYPWIRISLQHDFPRLSYHRGAHLKREKYLGPFSDAGAARRSLRLAQKLFRVRSCEDSVFAHRSRPCLQYQINRCTAPCVNYISRRMYRRDVDNAILFLEGKNEEVLRALTVPMEQAAAALDFERAAQLRDQIGTLRRIQEKQRIAGSDADMDIVYCAMEKAQACVSVMRIRRGLNLGSRAFFPSHEQGSGEAEVLSAFISQNYLHEPGEQDIPREILVNVLPENASMLKLALGQHVDREVRIHARVRGRRAQWLEMAAHNAVLSLRRHLAGRMNQTQRLADLQAQLGMDAVPERIECFDISHTQGEATVAACVVFGSQGALFGEYRRMNIRGNASGDDCLSLREAVGRRYSRRLAGAAKLPDLILVDGGKAQLNAAMDALRRLSLGHILLLGVVKGEGRRAKNDHFIRFGDPDSSPVQTASPAAHLLQQLRDEAHRVAIGGHRRHRAARRRTSMLEGIEGIGSVRRQALLRHFGGLQGVMRAGVRDLVCVPGISTALAEKVYASFHPER